MTPFLYSTLSGILLFFCFPKANLSFLAWIALIPLIASVKGAKPGKSFLFGFISGVVFFCGYLYWLVPTFTAAGEPWITGVVVLLLLSSYLALYLAVFCALSTRFSNPLFLASLWVVLEYIKGHLFSGIPAGILGYSQWNFLPVIQVCDITGVYGVSFLIVFVNVAVFRYILSRFSKPLIRGGARGLIYASLIFAAFLFYGAYRLSGPGEKGESPGFKVAVLQGNIDQYKKWDRNYADEIMNVYDRLAKESTFRDRPDLIVWPESSIPGFLLEEKQLYRRIKGLANLTQAYHLIGSADTRDGKYFNSAVLLSPDGSVASRYDKIHLVPFGEAVPLKSFLGKFIKAVNELGGFTAGEKYTVFSLPFNNRPVRFSSNICFESIFPELVRKFRYQEFIINITNDAWYLKTSAPYEHFTFNVFRAVENRKQVVRCANTGISGHIDSRGRIISRTEIFTAGAPAYLVNPNTSVTFYSRFGDLFVFFCLIVILYFVLQPARFKR